MIFYIQHVFQFSHSHARYIGFWIILIFTINCYWMKINCVSTVLQQWTRQQCLLNQSSSEVVAATWVIPQRIVLGPVMFILYLKAIIKTIKVCAIYRGHQYVSLTHNCYRLIQEVNSEYNKISVWIHFYKTSLNISNIIFSHLLLKVRRWSWCYFNKCNKYISCYFSKVCNYLNVD